MNNEHEDFVPEIDTTVTLTTPEAPGTTNGVDQAVEEAAARLNLDDESQARLRQLLTPLESATIPGEVVDLLAIALRHDEEVSNAEANGYLRGRNENIDVKLNLPEHNDDFTAAQATFPRYAKRSVWD